MSKVYTKAGDRGETGLLSGARVPKDHLRIRVYGTFDETNSVLGIVLAGSDLPTRERERLQRTQVQLFHLGSELAAGGVVNPGILLVGKTDTDALEREIDEMEASMQPLQHFILPGGTLAASHLHLARTVIRRAERELVVLNRDQPVRPELLEFVNRLSDYFFVFARYVNHLAGKTETQWKAR